MSSKKRTIFDPNEFIIEGNICWVILYNRKCIEVARAKFYTIYYETIKNSNLKWHLRRDGYVEAVWYDKNNKQQHTVLHETIIQLSGQEVPIGYEIDHKNGDKLNCLDDNLRICTYAQNQHNVQIRNSNTSGFKGVSWHKASKRWIAEIMNNRKKIYLGIFSIKEDAARAYNAAAIKYHGEFAQLNSV